MAIQFHPEQGTILVCDFNGFKAPEMIKRRPVVVVSPRLRKRTGLCTVVPLSTTPPVEMASFHCKLRIHPPLPDPYGEPVSWVKGDMVYTVSFDRLSLPFDGKDAQGKRKYELRVLDRADLLKIQECVLHGIGLSSLTAYL